GPGRRPLAAGTGRALVPRCRSATGVRTMADDALTEILDSAKALDVLAPWPRFEVDSNAWTRIDQLLKAGDADMLALWGEPHAVHLTLRAPASAACVVSLAISDGSFPSIGQFHPPAIRLERTIHDLYGIVAKGCPDRRPWLDHGAWELQAPLGMRASAPLRDPADYAFLPVKGQGLHQVPVGPVHAGIIEPGHFRFTANGEMVARLEEGWAIRIRGSTLFWRTATSIGRRASPPEFPVIPPLPTALPSRVRLNQRSAPRCRHERKFSAA